MSVALFYGSPFYVLFDNDKNTYLCSGPRQSESLIAINAEMLYSTRTYFANKEITVQARR